MGYGQCQIRITHLFSHTHTHTSPKEQVSSYCELPLWSYYKAQYFWSTPVWVQGMNLAWLCSLGMDTQGVSFLTSMWSQEQRKIIYRNSSLYQKLNCPICTSMKPPQQCYCSLNRVGTYKLCKLLTPSFFSCVYIWQCCGAIHGARPDGGSWPLLSRGFLGYFPRCVVSKATTAGGLGSVPLSRAPGDLHGICLGNPWRRPACLHLCLCGQI